MKDKQNLLSTIKKNIFDNHFISLCIAILIITALLCSATTISKTYIYKKHTPYEVYKEYNQLKYDSLKSVLVENVDNYIKEVAPPSALDGLVIVNYCIDYDIDVCFVLAQGEIESHFGTKGLARKTNSVFNVFAYDGKDYNSINKNGKYAHPDDSVEPYLRLLKNDYLIDNKTEYDLLSNYINKDGNRYASAKNYEKMLTDKFEKIKNKTEIHNIYLLLKKQRLILGLD